MAEPSSNTAGQSRNKLLCGRLAARGADRATNVHRPGRRIPTQAFDRLLRGDLHDHNVMRGGYGQSVLIDLKSCGLDRIVALDLLCFAVGRYPDDLTTNPARKIVRIHATGWDLPMIQPFLPYIDLPRTLWGQIYLLHLLGSVALKPSRRFGRARDPKQNPLLSGLLTRLIAVGRSNVGLPVTDRAPTIGFATQSYKRFGLK